MRRFWKNLYNEACDTNQLKRALLVWELILESLAIVMEILGHRTLLHWCVGTPSPLPPCRVLEKECFWTIRGEQKVGTNLYIFVQVLQFLFSCFAQLLCLTAWQGVVPFLWQVSSPHPSYAWWLLKSAEKRRSRLL